MVDINFSKDGWNPSPIPDACFRTSYRVLGDRDDAENVAQEATMKVYRYAESYGVKCV